MLTALLLLALGLLLIFFEFYVPGMVLGAGGVIMIIASVSAFAKAYGSLGAVLAYVVFVAVAITLLVRYTLKRIRGTAKEGTIYLESDEEGFTASQFDHSLIGKAGVASSDLKPSGHVTVDGNNYQASSDSEYIVKGTPIVVIGGRGANLIVKQKGTAHD